MAIEFVGGKTAGKLGATSGNTTIALNSGLTGGIRTSVEAGDLVIAAFATGSAADRTLTITDGTSNYTLIDSELVATDTEITNLRVAYKFMSGSPDASTTFGPTLHAQDGGAMAVYVFRGVHETTPLDVAAVPATGTDSLLANPASIQPTTTGAYIVCVGAGAHDGGQDTFSSSDLTDFLSVGAPNETNDISLGIGHKPDWTSGAFNAAVWTSTQADSVNYSWAAMSIALRPAQIILAAVKTLTLTRYAATITRATEVLANVKTLTLTTYQADVSTAVNTNVNTNLAALVLTTNAVSVDRDITTNLKTLTLTTQPASFTRNVEVLANVRALTLTTYQAQAVLVYNTDTNLRTLTLTTYAATLTRNVEVFAALKTLVLTRNAAAITRAINVDANLKTLTLTTYAAAITRAINVDANLKTLTLTKFAAAITRDINVDANLKTLTLTAYAASFTRNVDVGANLKTLTLTTRAANISTGAVGTDVNTNLAMLVLTRYAATVQRGVNILTSTKALVLTRHTAAVSRNVELTTVLRTLTLTTHQATVLVSRNIAANTAALALTTYAASIDLGITARRTTLTLVENPATVLYVLSPVLEIPDELPIRVDRVSSTSFTRYLTAGDNITAWSLSGPPIAGMTFDTNTGIYSGTPTAIGLFTGFTVEATNSAGSGISAQFDIRTSISIPRAIVVRIRQGQRHRMGGR